MSDHLWAGTLLAILALIGFVALLSLGSDRGETRDRALRDAAERWASRAEQDMHPVLRPDFRPYRGNNRHDRRRHEARRVYW